MDTTTFEKYLMDVFAAENPGVLDDESPDRFEAWIENLDADDMYKLAEVYALEVNKKILK